MMKNDETNVASANAERVGEGSSGGVDDGSDGLKVRNFSFSVKSWAEE